MNRKRATRLSLDLLRGFRSAARHLSFTRAAQDLFVTQSAISREIKTLEEQLGQPLFRRVNRTLQLTPAGEGLYRIADETLTQLDAEVERITGAARLWRSLQRPGLHRCGWHLGYSASIARIPASTCGWWRATTSQSRARPARHCHSICVGGHRRSRQRTFSTAIYPACSPALANDKLHPIRTPADLAHHVRLDYESMRDGRRLSLWDFWFDKMKIPHVKPASTLQFPQYDQLVSAAIEGSGVGIAVLPHTAQHLHRKPCAFHSGWRQWRYSAFSTSSAARCCWTRGGRGVRRLALERGAQGCRTCASIRQRASGRRAPARKPQHFRKTKRSVSDSSA